VTRRFRRRIILLAMCVCLSGVETSVPQQPKRLNSFDLAQGHFMLRMAYEEIKKNYYDPKFHGVDLETVYTRVDKALDGAASNSDVYFLIAGFVSALDDSHTYFIPPTLVHEIDRGFQMGVVGEACFVTHVRPKTDAALKLHPGDRILSINGYKATRESYDLLQYVFQTLSPVPELTMELVDPNGARRTEVVKATTIEHKALIDVIGGVDELHQKIDEQNEAHRNRERYYVNGDIVVWKMPDFEADDDAVNTMFGIARKHGTLILDLRGNLGGDVDTLKLMLQHVFDHEIKLADEVARKNTKPMTVKAGKWGAYNGKLIVLIDRDSASASEMFARVIQMEHRGTVMGDVSAGAVMESRQYQESIGERATVDFTLSITWANLVMTDGRSLEKVGVVPDTRALPTAQALAAGEDPVLAQAINLAGGQIDAAAAGRLFPVEWPRLRKL